MTSFKRFEFKKGTWLSLVPFLFFALAAEAQTGLRDSAGEMVKKAQSMTLQRDRVQATRLLAQGLSAEKNKGASRKELLATFDQISRLFFSDKTQQSFELALSLKPTDEELTVQKLREAQRMEPDNFAIEEALMRIRLAARDCEAVLGSQKNFPDQYLYIHSGQVLVAQALVCLGRYDEALKLKPIEYYMHTETLSAVWLALEVEIHFKKSEFIKAREKALVLRGLNPKYPEAYYWSFMAENQLKMPSESSGQKYFSLCRGLSLRQKREFDLDPFLCRRVSEVETIQKKSVEASN